MGDRREDYVREFYPIQLSILPTLLTGIHRCHNLIILPVELFAINRIPFNENPEQSAVATISDSVLQMLLTVKNGIYQN